MKRRALQALVASLVIVGLLGCAAPLRSTNPLTPDHLAATPQLVTMPTATQAPTATRAPSPTATLLPTATRTPTPMPEPLHITNSYPINGDQAMGEQRPVVLTFDRPVNAAQIEAHLHISPTMMGRISWPTAQRLIFEPADRWAAKQWYQVSLEAGAQAEDGGMLDKLWSIRFMHGGRGAPLPILMYHHVTELGPEATESQRTWSVSPQMLQAQLDYLAAEGWQTISPEQLADYLVEGEPLPSKPLMITFDDGYREVYEHAYPLLAKTALRPTLFIIVDSVELGYSSVMDWAQLQELAAAGFYFGSHSKNHADLRRQNAADLDEQIGGSQRILEEKLGIRIQAFCYPYGSGAWDDAVLATLARYGYRTGYTINPTYYQNPQEPLRLGRLRISYEMSVEDLASLLPDF